VQLGLSLNGPSRRLAAAPSKLADSLVDVLAVVNHRPTRHLEPVSVHLCLVASVPRRAGDRSGTDLLAVHCVTRSPSGLTEFNVVFLNAKTTGEYLAQIRPFPSDLQGIMRIFPAFSHVNCIYNTKSIISDNDH
jgi:hypothetical protein